MHIRLRKVKQEARGGRDQSHGLWARGTAWKDSRAPWGMNSEEKAKKGTIKPNTKNLKKGLYDL